MQLTDKIERMIASLSAFEAELLNATEETYEDTVIEYLRSDCDIQDWSHDAGVSKMVIFVRGEDVVIKVPFSAMVDTDEYEFALSAFDRCEEDDDGNLLYANEPIIEEYMIPFNNAKINELKDSFCGYDYCEVECALYRAAQQEGLADYFAQEEKVYDHNGLRIYIQQRVNPLEVCRDERYSVDDVRIKSTRENCSSLGVACFNPIWIADFIDWYGEDEFLKLSTFLEHYGIHDFHSGNLGYYDEIPILLDYSGYDEW